MRRQKLYFSKLQIGEFCQLLLILQLLHLKVDLRRKIMDLQGIIIEVYDYKY